MKKQMRALLLAAAMLCAGLVSCADGAGEAVQTDTLSDTAPVTEAVTEDPDYVPDGLAEQDFGGETVSFLTTVWYNATQYIYASEANGDVVNDALYDARTAVEERFNVKVALTADKEFGETARLFHNAVMAGDKVYDILYNHDLETIKSSLNGDFLNLRSIDVFDFSKPWWTQTTEEFTIADKLYCTSSHLSLAGVYLNYILAINKDLASANDLEIPYDKVRGGAWYMDDLIVLCKDMPKDLNGDGKMGEEDQYGFLSSYYGNMGMQSNFGGTVLGKDGDGNLILLDNSDKIVSILEKVEELYEYGTDEYGGGNEYCMHMFVEGQGLFSLTESRVLMDQARDTAFSWGVLPFPKFDETQEEYRSAGCDLYWGISLTAADRTDVIATVIEALSCENYNNVLPAVWELMLGAKLSDAPDDADMFAVIRDAQYVDLGYAFSGQSSQLSQLVFLVENTEPGKVISYMEKRLTAVEKFIEKMNTAYAELP